MGYIEDSLSAGEQLRWRTKLHWVAFTWPVFILVIPFILILLRIGLGAMALVMFLPIGSIWLAAVALNVRTTELAVTDRRVLAKLGWFRRTTLEIFLSKVESVQLSQGIFGRLLDYGTVIICGTGGSREQLKNIEAPLGFRRAIQGDVPIENAAYSPRQNDGPRCPRCGVAVQIAHPICPKCGQRVRVSRPA